MISTLPWFRLWLELLTAEVAQLFRPCGTFIILAYDNRMPLSSHLLQGFDICRRESRRVNSTVALFFSIVSNTKEKEPQADSIRLLVFYLREESRSIRSQAALVAALNRF